jgi:urocanate hydratase
VLQENRRIYKTDTIAKVLEEMAKTAPIEIQQQMQDNIQWIKGAQENKLVVGSSENSLCRCEGRVKIASAFNQAIAKGWNHCSRTRTITMFPEQTLLQGNIKHLRRIAFTADMAIQNVIGDSFRGATWVSIHNGGGVGWER